MSIKELKAVLVSNPNISVDDLNRTPINVKGTCFKYLIVTWVDGCEEGINSLSNMDMILHNNLILLIEPVLGFTYTVDLMKIIEFKGQFVRIKHERNTKCLF